MSVVDFSGTRFEHVGSRGDGNKMVEPSDCELNFVGYSPIKLSKSLCRQLIIIFMTRGYTSHSVSMSTAWVVLEYCRTKNIGYELELCSIRRTHGGEGTKEVQT